MALYEEEETIQLKHAAGEDPGRVRELRINCPDATGLGVDIFRVLLDFGLRIIRADITTDSNWCFLVLAVALTPGVPARWQLLQTRLLEICPSSTDALRLLCPLTPKKRIPYAVHVSGYDRQGMLHALAHALWEADTAVFKAHVTTADDGEVRDTFWLFDNRDELPEPHRVLEICDRVRSALGADVICQVEPAPSHAYASSEDSPRQNNKAASAGDLQDFLHATGSGALSSSLGRIACKDAASHANLRAIADRRREQAASSSRAASCYSGGGGSDNESSPHHSYTASHTSSHHSRRHSAVSFDTTAEVSVEIDNSASQSHTLLTLRCKDRKGLLYDLLLKLKEVDVRLAFGRVDVDQDTGDCIADLYVQDNDYGRIEDSEALDELAERLREAAALPVRIEVNDVMEGAATELMVSANVDVGGRGRPRVTYDVTQGLCVAGLGVARADVYVEESEPPSPSNPASVEEIHRFLVQMPNGGGLESEQDRSALMQVVKACLLGVRTPQGPAARLSGACGASLGSSPRLGSLGAGSGELDQNYGPHSRPPSLPLPRCLSDAWKGH